MFLQSNLKLFIMKNSKLEKLCSISVSIFYLVKTLEKDMLKNFSI